MKFSRKSIARISNAVRKIESMSDRTTGVRFIPGVQPLAVPLKLKEHFPVNPHERVKFARAYVLLYENGEWKPDTTETVRVHDLLGTVAMALQGTIVFGLPLGERDYQIVLAPEAHIIEGTLLYDMPCCGTSTISTVDWGNVQIRDEYARVADWKQGNGEVVPAGTRVVARYVRRHGWVLWFIVRCSAQCTYCDPCDPCNQRDCPDCTTCEAFSDSCSTCDPECICESPSDQCACDSLSDQCACDGPNDRCTCDGDQCTTCDADRCTTCDSDTSCTTCDSDGCRACDGDRCNYCDSDACQSQDQGCGIDCSTCLAQCDSEPCICDAVSDCPADACVCDGDACVRCDIDQNCIQCDTDRCTTCDRDSCAFTDAGGCYIDCSACLQCLNCQWCDADQNCTTCISEGGQCGQHDQCGLECQQCYVACDPCDPSG